MAEITNEKINIKEAKESLLKSGYLLENRLEKILNEREFVVTANYIYPDPFEDKSREIDLSALKCEVYGDENMNTIFLNLIVECVNNDQPIAFFTKEPTFENYYPYEELKIIGKPEKIDNEILAYYFRFDKFHHYCKGDIATQWCTFQKKRQGSSASDEWMAFHHDDFHKTFQKLCFATQYQISEQEKSYENANKKIIDIQLYYPIFVTQNEIFEVKTNGDIKLSNANHIKYLRTEYLSGKFISSRIDVVTEEYFYKLLDIIEDEFQKMSQIIKEKTDKLKEALKNVILA